MNELDLYNVPLPEATDTYIPVSHQHIIEKVMGEMSMRNMSIRNKQYLATHKGNRLIGYFDIDIPNSSELGLRFAFRNSYDKSMSIGIVSGAQVWICSNGMIKGDGIKFIRKHTGNVLSEVDTIISESMSELNKRAIEYVDLSSRMKKIEITKDKAAYLYGKAFFCHNLFTIRQLQQIKKELHKPSFEDFNEDSLWSVYNHVTYAFRKGSSNINNYFQQYVNWHTFIEDEFNLGVSNA